MISATILVPILEIRDKIVKFKVTLYADKNVNRGNLAFKIAFKVEMRMRPAVGYGIANDVSGIMLRWLDGEIEFLIGRFS